MKRIYLLLILTSLLSVGCGGLSRQLEFTDTASHSLVFGYLDIEKSPCNLDWIQFRQVSPAIEKPYYFMRIEHGAFYREDFTTPGSFQLTEYGGSGKGFLNGNTQYSMKFPPQGYGFSLQQAGRIYFLGSYRIYEKGDFFASDTFLEKTEHPNQLEVLQMILPNAKGTQWETIIQNAIRTLSH